MNVGIGSEAALFPEKEYINGIAVAVWGGGRRERGEGRGRGRGKGGWVRGACHVNCEVWQRWSISIINKARHPSNGTSGVQAEC
jgi:hypothetical protein